MKKWEESWFDYHGRRTLGSFFLNDCHKIIFKIIDDIILKDSKIIDIGCGSGVTLHKFRLKGYRRAVGMDHSMSSISLCQRRGFLLSKDVFLVDAFKVPFDSNSFDLVFSEGLIEHFEDFNPIVKEMCRISNKYVLLIQPNHFSPFKTLSDIYYYFFPNPDNVKEFTYTLNDFNFAFKKFGFKLEKINNSLLGAFWILLFKKMVM